MEELYTEVEKDMANGVTAVGKLNYAAFTGTAHRLGCGAGAGSFETWSTVCKPATASALRAVQANAATARQNRTVLCQGSGQKLGSTSVSSGFEILSPRAKRAAAAQRRKEQQNSALTVTSGGSHGSELSSSRSGDSALMRGKKRARTPTPLQPSAVPVIIIDEDDDESSCDLTPRRTIWVCRVCTFENSSQYPDASHNVNSVLKVCGMCGAKGEDATDDGKYNNADVECLGSFPLAASSR
eukprot:CAMPEP_0114459936 /NCGR_PEP_ID=MMETSP0104-20121206/5475_1 /TAXON_ID=37642 ORGANISM="Paraphysomonas imperforata, Strain PA2" /NCGR_SAMPLE_ID=MMETSP0104 /ASSEMBLY_ACC=CAM_ASM_000202 /LENGTH=240 /DNA_ID=CAMNT_0001632609 /DNA_START=246 /DNA_END=964 /DNA_ORIENTATION=-